MLSPWPSSVVHFQDTQSVIHSHMCCTAGWGLSVGVPQRLRCTVHSTVLSCHCLSSSLPLLCHHPQSWSGHACPPCPGRRQQSKGTDPEQNKHYWMAAFHIPERSRSLTVDLWSNVAWSEPTEAASVPSSTLFQAPFAYCQTMPSIAIQGRRRVTGRLPIFILPSQSHDWFLLLLRNWGSGDSNPVGFAFP